MHYLIARPSEAIPPIHKYHPNNTQIPEKYHPNTQIPSKQCLRETNLNFGANQNIQGDLSGD